MTSVVWIVLAVGPDGDGATAVKMTADFKVFWLDE